MKTTRWTAALAALAALVGLQAASAQGAPAYSTRGAQILENGRVWVGGGVNAFDQFGPGAKSGRDVTVVREVIDDARECPISKADGTLQTPIGTLHSLQDIVDNNRAQGQVTILCVFGWDTADNQQLTGKFPDQQPWWSSGSVNYLSRLSAIAKQFVGQPDVWIDPWNEPWSTSQIAPETWLHVVGAMYHAIRDTGNQNIVLIPCPDWDADSGVYTRGALARFKNVAATVHCYNGWTRLSVADNEARMRSTLNAGWPLVAGECGPDQWVKDPKNSLEAAVALHVPILAWSWNSQDGAALVQGDAPTPWGEEFFSYMPRLGASCAQAAAKAH